MAVELIAEVSSNHGGNISLAKEFIHRSAAAGADFVKFQTTRVKHLRPDDPQYAWFQRAELSDEAHWELKAECAKAGTKFLTTVYHAEDVPFVASLGLEAVKIGSGEAQETALAEAVMMASFRRVFVALGLCRNNPCWSAFARDGWYPEFLGAVSRYPAPASIAALVLSARSISLATSGHYHVVAGWSDHAVGLGECFAAIALGASIIEKHVSLPHQARPVKSYEATVEEFKALRQFADEDPQRYLGRWQHT